MSDGGSRHSRQQRRHLAGRVTFGKRFDAAIAGMADRVLRLGGGRIVGEERNSRRLSPDEVQW